MIAEARLVNFIEAFRANKSNPVQQHGGEKINWFNVGEMRTHREWSDDHPLNETGCDYESILSNPLERTTK